MTLFAAVAKQIDETRALGRKVMRIRVTESALVGSISAAPLLLDECEIVIHPSDYFDLRWEMEGLHLHHYQADPPRALVQVSIDGIPVIHDEAQ